MNNIISYLIQIAVTFIVVLLIAGYLRPYLKKILVDLCGTEERAQFWTVFSNILLIGLPLLFALNYRPESANGEELFFEVVRKLSGNLGAMLFAIVGVGLVVSFFALVAACAPRFGRLSPRVSAAVASVASAFFASLISAPCSASSLAISPIGSVVNSLRKRPTSASSVLRQNCQ